MFIETMMTRHLRILCYVRPPQSPRRHKMREDSLRLLFALISTDIYVDIRMITTQKSQQGDETFISETPRELTEERER